MIPSSPKYSRLLQFSINLINIIVIFGLIISLFFNQPPINTVSAQSEESEATPVVDEQWQQPDEPFDHTLEFYDRLVEHDNPLGNHQVEKPEERVYISPSPEDLALTQAQVDSFDCNTVTDVPVIECEALVALYASTNGAGWYSNTNWLATTTVGNWTHVIVSMNRVTHLILNSNRLTGSIPPELGNLSNLVDLTLSGNQLTGSIPPELGNLSNLKGLGLSNNQLTGAIPPELGNLSYLERLYLSGNQLTGSIPPELGNLSNLKNLGLSNNQLTGSSLPELVNLSNLEGLDLSNNQLTGSIPPELGNLSNLDYLYLSGNQLTGSIPPELGNLSNLVDLTLSGNQLTGSIPPELGNLSNLEGLDLSNNQLTGSILPELGNLTNLLDLFLYNNQLTGSIPPELGNLSYLEVLWLSSNQLSGAIPPELGNLSNLVYLYLDSNQLTGTIPLSFTSLTSLDWLIFSNTSLCEPTTPEFNTWKATVLNWEGTGMICDVKPWLLMYYLAGDNNLSKYVGGFIDTITRSQNENINVAIFDDPIGAPVRYIGINDDGRSDEQKSELNTGDPQTLIDFITWAKTNYPAHHTALIIFDHGNALSGVAEDYSSDRDSLSPPELKQAFSTAGGVDVLQMYACLMANLEAQYQLRGFADYYIGIENLGWPVNYFNEYIPDISLETQPRELAVNIAKNYTAILKPLNQREISQRRPSTISVVDMSKIDNLAAKTSAMANVMSDNRPETKSFVWSKTDSSILQRFDSSGDLDIDNDDLLADLYHFALLLSEEQKFYVAAHDVMMAVEESVIYKDYWDGPFEINGAKYEYDLSNSHGVSIGLPRRSISYYKGDWLDFAEGADWVISPSSAETDTTVLGWGAFVTDLVKDFNPSAPDSPNPPDLVSPLINDTPIITIISPARVLGGSAGLTLTVDGVGFMSDSVINWNGVSRPTTFISGTRLITQLFASDLETIGLTQITVTTPGVEDGTSNEYEFVITDHLPDSDEKMTTSKVTFSWVPIENAIKYKLQLSTKPDFSVLLLNVKVTEPTYFFDTFLQNNKTFYWRIRPFYADSKGDWLPNWQFTSMYPLVKTTPTYPDHKQILTTPDVTLVWEMVENATQYKVVIAKDALFQNKVTSLKTADMSASFTLPDGKYYWRVRALDPYGAKGPWSDYRKFTVDAE